MCAYSSLNKASFSFHKLEMKTTMVIFLISVVCFFSSVQPRVGQTQVSLPQYSGYVTVDPSAGRALFYWFTEADESSTQPLMLWLSRGSLISDFAYTQTKNPPFSIF